MTEGFMFVKPSPGLKVRDWRTRQFIPETGMEVPTNDAYWQQRLAQKDVVKATASKPGGPLPDAHDEPPQAGTLVTGEEHASSPSEEHAQ